METATGTSAFKRILRSKAFTLIILLVALIVLFTILASLNDAKFFTYKTFVNILQDLAIPAFLAIGAGCLLVAGSIDFSQWAAGAIAGMIVAVGIAWWHLPWYVTFIIALIITACIGALNAVLVNVVRMAPFIATMATTAIIRAISMLIGTNSQHVLQSSVNFNDPTITVIGTYSVGGVIPATVILALIAFVVYGLMLSSTRLGRSIYMIGGNPNASRLAGLNAQKISYFLFINCSVMGGIAGLIYTSRSKQGGLQALQTDQFTGMTAAILGGISFGGGSGGMGGAFIGLLVIKTFNKGMLISGSSTYLTTVLSGALLLAALTLDYVSLRRQRKRIGA